MMKYLISIFFLLGIPNLAMAFVLHEVEYVFSEEPIDVVIPAIDKDLKTLNFCIEGIKTYCANVRRIIVVSAKRLTDQAEWFDEKNYPFSKKDIAIHLLKGDVIGVKRYLYNSHSRLGWYYQQLLKFYAPFVIPEISKNVLVLDADTIFLKDVEFMNESFAGLYNPAREYHIPYFEHAARLLPGLKRVNIESSGIAHHMLFQKCVLDDFFHLVEGIHQMPLWQAFCNCVAPNELFGSGAAEYEIYFNFVFARTKQVEERVLKWANIKRLNTIPFYQSHGYHYVSCHSWDRSS